MVPPAANATQPIILMVGMESPLGYLIGWYAETSGYHLRAVPAAACVMDVRALLPILRRGFNSRKPKKVFHVYV